MRGVGWGFLDGGKFRVLKGFCAKFLKRSAYDVHPTYVFQDWIQRLSLFLSLSLFISLLFLFLPSSLPFPYSFVTPLFVSFLFSFLFFFSFFSFFLVAP
jgi:hypothetical protein